MTERWQTEIDDGWIGAYLGNHDQPQMVSFDMEHRQIVEPSGVEASSRAFSASES